MNVYRMIFLVGLALGLASIVAGCSDELLLGDKEGELFVAHPMLEACEGAEFEITVLQRAEDGTVTRATSRATVADGLVSFSGLGEVDFDKAISIRIRVISARECEFFEEGQVWVGGPLEPAKIDDDSYGIDLDDASLGVTGSIEVGEPTVTPDKEGAVQVDIRWPVTLECACEDIVAQQEIKGFIESFRQDGQSQKVTAMRIVLRNTIRFREGTNAMADDIRTRNTNGETGETEFIPDFGAHGSNIYPPQQVDCEDLGGGRSRITLRDEPGSTMIVGPGRFFVRAVMNLTFRTTLRCKDEVVGTFIWHLRYELPDDEGTGPDVALGD